MGMVKHKWALDWIELLNWADADFLHMGRLRQKQQIDTVISSGLQ